MTGREKEGREEKERTGVLTIVADGGATRIIKIDNSSDANGADQLARGFSKYLIKKKSAQKYGSYLGGSLKIVVDYTKTTLIDYVGE